MAGDFDYISELQITQEELDQEIWKNIHPDYGCVGYKISNLGRVFIEGTGKLMKFRLNQDGYINCRFTREDDRKNFMIHELVLATFEGSKPTKSHTVDHINKTRYDNKINNLRWATKQQQNENRNKYSKIGAKGIPVDVYSDDNEFIKTYKNATSAANELEIDNEMILKCCRYNKKKPTEAKYKRYAGYIWKFPNTTVENEIWKVIDYKCLGQTYEVSNLGRVKISSIDKISELTNLYENYPDDHPNKYVRISLCNKNPDIDTKYYVHNLVAYAFIENPDPENYDIVNHKDGVKYHNSIDNLEWCSQSMNVQHAHDTGLINCYTKSIRVTNIYTNEIVEYESILEASEATGVNKTSITYVINGDQYASKGFIFEHVNSQDTYITLEEISNGIFKIKQESQYNPSTSTNDNLEGEIWIDIHESQNLSRYQVSNLGRIIKKSDHNLLKVIDELTNTIHPKQLTMDNNKRAVFELAKLMKISFHGPCDMEQTQDDTVYYKDNNPNNIAIDNLVYVYELENIHQESDVDSDDESNFRGGRIVLQYDKKGNLIRTFKSPKHAAKVTGYDNNCISEACRGVRKTHKGFTWKYKDNEDDQNIENEQWELINDKEYKFAYYISNCGRLKRVQNDKDYYMKGTMTTTGIKTRLTLTNDKTTGPYFHNFVAMYFLPNDNSNNKLVGHKDGNKANNHVDNLYWTNKSETSTKSHAKRRSE